MKFTDMTDEQKGNLIRRRIASDDPRSDRQLGIAARVRFGNADPRSFHDAEFDEIMSGAI